MPVEVAEGGISLVEENLARTLADCPRFRAWALAANQSQALARIYFDSLPPPEAEAAATGKDQAIGLRPFALISTNMQNGYSRGRVGTETYAEAGSLTIVFEENVPGELQQDDAAASRRFKNTLGVILNEMLALAYEATYLAIDQLTLQGPARCHPDDVPSQGDHQFAAFVVAHGVGQVR